MAIDTDIQSFTEYNNNCTDDNAKITQLAPMVLNAIEPTNNQKIPVRRSGVWSVEGISAYNGHIQDFGSVSGYVDLEFNTTTGLTSSKAAVIGDTFITSFPNLISGYVYKLFLVNNGFSVRFPYGTIILGSVNTDQGSVTEVFVVKLPNGKTFIKCKAFLPNEDVGEVIKEFEPAVITYPISNVEIPALSFTWQKDEEVYYGGTLENLYSDWEVASDSLYTNLLFSSYGNSDDLYSIFVILTSSGINYIRTRFGGDISGIPVVGPWASATIEVGFYAINLWDIFDTALTMYIDPNDSSAVIDESSILTSLEDRAGLGTWVSTSVTVTDNALNGLRVLNFSSGKAMRIDSSTGPADISEDPVGRLSFFVVTSTVNMASCGESTTGTCLYNNNAGGINFGDPYQVFEIIGANGVGAGIHRPNIISVICRQLKTMSDGYHIVCFKWNYRTCSVYIDGEYLHTGLNASQTAGYSTNLGNAPYGYFTGKVAKHLIITGDISDDTIDRVFGVLAHEYNLASLLPTDHPYKSIPPCSLNEEMAITITYMNIISGDLLHGKYNSSTLYVSSVGGSSDNVGVAVELPGGTSVTFNTDGTYSINPTGCDVSGGNIIDVIEVVLSLYSEEITIAITITVTESGYASLIGVSDPFDDGSELFYFPLTSSGLEFDGKYTSTSTNVVYDDYATFNNLSTSNKLSLSAKPITTDTYSISAWLRMDAPGWGGIYCQNTIGWNGYGVEFLITSTMGVTFSHVRSDTTTANNTIYSGADIFDGVFHHFVVTRSGTSIKLYKDRELVSEGTLIQNTTANYANGYFGQHINGNTNTPQGVKFLRNVRAFNVELGQDGIDALYFGENPSIVLANVIVSDLIITNGNLFSSGDTASVFSVGGSSDNIGVAISCSNGGTITIRKNGSFSFNPSGMDASSNDVLTLVDIVYGNSAIYLEKSISLNITVTRYVQDDQHYSNVALLIQPYDDAIDGSTSITDRSLSARTISVNGNAQIDTSLGYPTVLLDGSGDFLTTPDNDVFDFTTVGTMEVLFRTPQHTKTLQTLLAKRSNAAPATGWMFYTYYDSSNLRSGVSFLSWSGGASTVSIFNDGYKLLSGTEYHAEVSRDSAGIMRLYLNGEFIMESSGAVSTNTQALYVGRQNTADSTRDFNGHIRARWTSGVARHTTKNNFIPPTKFPVG